MIVITGASSGIGAATALALARTAPLLLVARRANRLAQVALEVTALGGNAQVLAVDAARADAPRRIAEACAGVTGLVLNAGVFATATADAIDDDHLDALIAVNLRAPIRIASALAPRLQRGATVVAVSSHAARTPFAGCAAYAATKAGLEAWAAVARVEWRSRGVRVGIVAPGATDTEVWPSGTTFDRTRMCRPDDVAQAIAAMITMPDSASLDRVDIMPPAGAF